MMKSLAIVWVMLLEASLPGFASAGDVDEPSPDRPNILFLAIDDLRPQLGCYGCREILSPHIDRLADEGVTFLRAYCQQAVCNPSRVSVMTGLRPDSAQVWDLVTRFRETVPDVVTLPQQFMKHGYYAVSYGKIFHNPWPDNASWSEPHRWPEKSSLWSEESRQRLADYRETMRADGKSDAAIDRMRAPAVEISDLADHEHRDGAIAEQALAALRRLAKAEQPFFLAAGFVRPHLPFVVPRRYWELYDRESIPLAENTILPKDSPGFAMNTMYELRDYLDYTDAPNPRNGSLSESRQRELKHGYYAAVSFIDAQVGRLLDELDALGLAENTIVVLWGDHGWKLGEHNSWCKQSNYEIDARVPLIIRNPGAQANGSPTRALVELVDLYPTLCELAGLPLPDHLEGRSMVPLLSDADKRWKAAAFSQFRRRDRGRELMGYAMRTDRYRYVEWQDRLTREVVATELYDHASDPQENANLAPHADNESVLDELSRQLWDTLPPPPKQTGASPADASARPNAKPTSEVADRPNMVFLMADDWSWPHAGALGDPVVKTPHFDRIAREGVLFENAFVSTPSCTPSRLSILTGQHHWRLQEGDSLGGSLREEFDVYTEMLQEAGYRIGRYGKGVWPSQHTFRNRDSFGERFRSFDEFLKQRQPGEPFCYWHGGQDPHRPYQWEAGINSGIDLREVRVPACLPDNETVRTDLADYYWEVQRFDREVGAVLAKLAAIGELDNTIVVVSGDNGMPFPRCKATLYDQGTRVPLAVRWGAQVAGGRTVADFVSLCDLAPTFLEAAGIEAGASMTGRSLLPLLTSDQSGQIDPARTHVLTGMEQHVYSYPSRALRSRDFLYIRNFDPDQWPTGEMGGHTPRYDFASDPWPTEPGAFSFNIDPSPSKQFLRLHREEPDGGRFAALSFGPRPEEELYDLKEDPQQLHNVAGEPAYRPAKDQLRRQLDSELLKSDDPRLAVNGYTTRIVEGWAVRVSEDLMREEPKATPLAIDLLRGQLRTVSEVLPAAALARVKTVPIWLSPAYPDSRPTGEYHPNAGWLRAHGRHPALTRCVEFTTVPIFEKEIRRMPMMVLHELAHAYHDQVFGFEHPDIKAAWERAVDSGRYAAVRRSNGKTERAYALTNQMEYFAESSEAYFGTNDFFPFNREQLEEHDPDMLQLLSRVWGGNQEDEL